MKIQIVKQTESTLFFTLLAILFIGLKLTHYINWSWWWVLSPLWIPTAFVCILLIIFAIGALSLIAYETYKDKKRLKNVSRH
jgi:hypothetical protein